MHTLAPVNRQLSLLQVAPVYKAWNNATARNAYGSAAQEVACSVLGLTPIPINGNYSICFDAQDECGLLYEIKSVRTGCKLVLYDWRMEKEKTVLNAIYAVVIHRLKKHREDILSAMVTSGFELLIVPAFVVHKVAETFPLHRVFPCLTAKKRNGYTRTGYRNGYRNVPVQHLLNMPAIREDLSGWIYGKEFTTRIHRVKA